MGRSIRRVVILSALALVCFLEAGAQVRGRVTDGTSEDGQPLIGAAIYWAGTNIGVSADDNGEFNIGRVRGYDRLVASYVGYVSDTVVVTETAREIDFRLTSQQIETVVVSATARGNYTALDGILKGEVISFSGLTKMACCNLAESFENSASVTVGYSDAITGARQIKMLGLAGIYTQVLDETRPIMRGLGSPYSLSYTPGMWLEGIQLSKGITSVTGGHEAIAGQISLEYRKPTDESPLFVNVYADQDLRAEVNVAAAHKITDKLSHIVLTQASLNPLRLDHNGDGFLDTPIGRQFNIADRYLYIADNGMQIRGGIKYVNEKRLSGQGGFEPYSSRRKFNQTLLYGSEIANENFNAYFKLALPLGKYVYNEEIETAERSNLAFILDYNFFDTDSYFGLLKDYRGTQNSFYFNAMYSWNISSRHKLVSGITATSDGYKEYLHDGSAFLSSGRILTNKGVSINRAENEAGIYTEYNYNYRDRFSAVAGIRGDYSDLHGAFATPRAHLKWNIFPRLVLRGSAGMGYRSANVITDNIWMMATGRMIYDLESGKLLSESSLRNLDTQEKSLTYGGSLTWNFRLGADDNASLSFDYFHTQFDNQVIADQEWNANKIVIYSSGGPSYTDTYQADFNWTPFTGFDVLLTFRYNDTAVTLQRPDGSVETIEKPLTDRYKGLINLQYATRFRRWVFDFTAQINGPSRLPTQDGDLTNKEHSPAYPMFFAQVTRRLGVRTSIYLGCENIGNYMQDHPVTWTDSVHDVSFNSSRIWGPLMGRKIYIGARITF